MLHNTGAYGPNETPVNMGAPLNISQLATPMNMVQNLNNLSKIPQQPAPSASGHFNLPGYPTYGNPGVNMSPQMHPFPNYHSLGFQPSYMPQNSTIMQNAGWQNPILPMSLNMPGDPAQNMLNYDHLEKRLSQTISTQKEQHNSAKTALNIPQVPNKLYQKPPESIPSSEYILSDQYKPYKEDNLDLSIKSPESLLTDNTRRKNLENTVRLIENILINTTKNRDLKQKSELQHDSLSEEDYNDTAMTEPESPKIVPKPEESIVNDVQKHSDCDDEDSDGMPEDSDDNNDGNMHDDSDSCKQDEKEADEKVDSPGKGEEKQSVEESAKEFVVRNAELDTLRSDIVMEIKPVIKEEPIEVERQVVIKVEQIHSWTDTDHLNPFHRDMNGVTREDATHDCIVDSENSVAEATECIKNGSESESYYECPHCCLLFGHPKRLLIHVKWHALSFNGQKQEVAKEKEIKRQAERTERLESIPPGKAWPCRNCDKVYHSKGSLHSHRQRYHSNRTRECKICDARVTGWASWKAHQAAHSTEAGFQCSECPKRFKYAHSLAKHRDTHLEKTHACGECPKKFGSQALLKVHAKSHERARLGASFHCTFCGKPFYDKFNLQIHERTHTNERPFVCEICNATFGCNSNLSRHLKVSHSASKPHVCSTCNRSFATALIRDRHEMRLHGDPAEFKYTCKLCPSRYLKMVDLRKHTYKMHPKPKSEKKEKAAK